MKRLLLVHYHELALKGKNRRVFEVQLADNILQATCDLGISEARRVTGRLIFVLPTSLAWEVVHARLQHVFGIANYAEAWEVPPNLATVKEAVAERLQGLTFRSFRIHTKRADKGFPRTSVEINQEIGGAVQTLTGAAVDLDHPDLTISLEVVPRAVFISLARSAGPGGLPVGSSGVVACLISGGIDSPVAAYRMMKRGCRVVFIHFHSQPYLSRASQEKTEELVSLLTRHQYRSRLILVPFGEAQRQIVLGVKAPLRVILYRRFMFRIAEEIAQQHRAKALVTGESLGQVASQTLENLTSIEEAATFPILRPLIGHDKDEIVAEARRIGTYETSIQPDQDCCQLFIPTRPATWSTVDEVRRAEVVLDVGGLVKLSVERLETRDYTWPV